MPETKVSPHQIQIDASPTENSENPVKSGGVKSYVDVALATAVSTIGSTDSIIVSLVAPTAAAFPQDKVKAGYRKICLLPEPFPEYKYSGWIYLADHPWYELGEYFIFQIDTLTTGTFIIPTEGYGGASGDVYASYNWDVYVDGVLKGNYSGTGSAGSGISLTGLASGRSVIRIQQHGVTDYTQNTYQWFRAFGFRNNTLVGSAVRANKVKIRELLSPLPIKGMCVAEHDAGHNFCRGMFAGIDSTEFSMGDIFNLPEDITTVGDYFCRGMFNGCSTNNTFKMNDVFNLPQGITTAGDFFCESMFAGNYATPLFKMNEIFQLPQGITTAGMYFCNSMFHRASHDTFTINNIFNLPQNISGSVGSNFAGNMFYMCSGNSFKLNDVFTIPQGITSVGVGFCQTMFYQCYGNSFTMGAAFNLPPLISGVVSENFCMRLFNECYGADFTMNDVFNIPQGITEAGVDFCGYMFSECRGDNFTMGAAFNLPQSFNMGAMRSFVDMFYHCYGAAFQINDVFQLPQLLTAEAMEKSNFMSRLLSLDNTSATRHMQNRTAMSIIGDLPNPYTLKKAFTDTWTGGTVSENNAQGRQWSDYDLIPANWK